MRSRNIKPGFFIDEDLAELTMETRLLFIGLWCAADREGRLEDRPKRLKAQIFPFDAVNIEECLDALSRSGHIVRYEVDGAKIMLIKNFAKHQAPHRTERGSVLPCFNGEPTLFNVSRPCSNSEPTVSARENPLIPDSGLRIPDSPNPRTSKLALDGFAEFWQTYPRKEAKAAAEKAWSKVPVNLHATILTAIDKHRKSDQWTKDGGTFIPHASTWLNQRRWEDEVPEAARHKADDQDWLRGCL